MSSEPLEIHDKRFLINRLIQQAPKGTMIREFFKNAEESAAKADPGNRRIEIYPVEIDGVRKLGFWNTGPGMDAAELKRATDLSSSINKEMSLSGNFGIGAKVSGLRISPDGIRYRSCKSGTVHEVTIGYDEDQGTYVRFQVKLPDGTLDTVYDVTDAAKREGMPLSYDWTEVVLYGETPDHDTVAEPYGKGKAVDRSYVPTQIFRRFSSFLDGVQVKIDVAMTKGGGKDETGRFRQLRTLADVLDKLPKHEEILTSSGLKIRYIHDPKHESSSHSLSARANPATSSTTFCALVHKGERYDFKTTKGWSSVAPNFGIPFGSRVLTVEIELPADRALPTQYRDGLTWPEDSSAMLSEQFAPDVRDHMPAWVKEIIKSESPEADENLDDLESDLQKLLDEFRVPTTARASAKQNEAEPSEPEDEGTPATERTKVHDPDSELPRTLGDGRAPESPTMRRAQKKRVRTAPEGAQASKSMKALERVPHIEILLEDEDILEKSIKGRAGRYYKDAQALFINGRYAVVDRMAEELEREMVGTAEPDALREACLKASRRFMAFRVGKATCYAISKRLSDDWNVDDLDKATTPESLSMAADDYMQSINAAKKWVKEQLKTALIGEPAAA
jgi:hypothetical protein